jgi:hypothetical protein
LGLQSGELQQQGRLAELQQQLKLAAGGAASLVVQQQQQLVWQLVRSPLMAVRLPQPEM